MSVIQIPVRRNFSSSVFDFFHSLPVISFYMLSEFRGSVLIFILSINTPYYQFSHIILTNEHNSVQLFTRAVLTLLAVTSAKLSSCVCQGSF